LPYLFLSRAGQTFHHQSGAALGNMRDNRRAAMDLRYYTQVDCEGEVDSGAFLQSEILGFDEHAVRAQVTRAAQLARPSRNGDVDGGARAMSCMKASLHLQPLDSLQ
jgi:hypothetical protein